MERLKRQRDAVVAVGGERFAFLPLHKVTAVEFAADFQFQRTVLAAVFIETQNVIAALLGFLERLQHSARRQGVYRGIHLCGAAKSAVPRFDQAL